MGGRTAGPNRPAGGILGLAAALRALIIPTASNKTESTPVEGKPVVSSECVDSAIANGPQRESAKQRRNYFDCAVVRHKIVIESLLRVRNVNV